MYQKAKVSFSVNSDFEMLMQNVLHICKGRVVLFDNITKEEIRRSHQLHQLLSLVNMVDNENGGQPYTDEIFKQVKVNYDFNELTKSFPCMEIK